VRNIQLPPDLLDVLSLRLKRKTRDVTGG
jgi:hypothetical protein